MTTRSRWSPTTRSGVLTNAFNAMAGQLQSTLQAVDSERTKLSTLFLHMTDGVVAFNQSGEVIHANPAAEEMLDMEIPLGGTVTYQDLFGEIALLETILTPGAGLPGERDRPGRAHAAVPPGAL